MSADLVSHIARWAVATSWAAAVPAIVLLALGEWRSFPVRWRWTLSLVVAARLAIPAVPGISWHPLAMFESAPAASAAQAVDSAPQVAVASLWPMIWALGFAAVILWLAVSQFLLWHRISRVSSAPGPLVRDIATSCLRQAGVNAPVRIRMVPDLATPAVFGVWRPWLLLPEDIEVAHTFTEVRGILLHEIQHIRSRDALWTWGGLLLCALHWFNPLAWLCLRRFRADRELMCDARTLHLLSPRQRTAYGNALLKTWENATRHQPALLTPFLRRNSATYHRILMSLQPTKPNRLVHLVAILLVPLIAIFSLTTAKADGNAPKKPGETERAQTGDGDTPKPGKKKKGKRGRADGDGDAARKGTRDGDKPKEGPRDGDKPREGTRDGDAAKKTGPRDGDKPKEGPRDGDKK